MVEKLPIVGKSRPEFIGHGEGNVLPFTVGKNMLLLCNPLLCGLHATGATAFAFAALTEIFCMRAGWGGATITANAHGTCSTGKHALDDEFSSLGDSVPVFNE